MKAFFREARLVPVIVGNLKRSKLMRQILPLSTGGTNNARYCYSVWLRHLNYYMLNSNRGIPCTVAELGPGDSIGIGLSAILSGVEHYFALDVLRFWDSNKNIRIFDELLELFRRREDIPGDVEFPNVFPKIKDYAFPEMVLSEAVLKMSLSSSRIERIRKELQAPDDPANTIIKYQIPWYDSKVIQAGSVDLIISQAVLEHVDDLENAYSAMSLWLNDEGLMSHAIDFKCHGMTKSWNGHWCLSEFEWQMVRGGRVYAINRQPLSVHIKLLEKNGFNLNNS